MTVTNQTSTQTAEQIPASLPNDIVFFLIGGSIGFLIFSVIIKKIKGWWIRNKILADTINEQQQHWQQHVRPEFKRLLLEFYKDLRRMTIQYFPRYQEEILYYQESQVLNYIDSIIPKTNLYVH
jgi:hypothetical protein